MLWLSSGGLGIRIPERGLGPLCSLGTWWTHGKEGKDYNLSGSGDQDPTERIRISLQPGCCVVVA